MRVKVFGVIFNILLIIFIVSFKLSLELAITFLLFINISLFVLYKIISSLQENELNILSDSIDNIIGGKNLVDYKYNEEAIEKINHRIAKLNRVLVSREEEIALSQKEVQDSVASITHQLRGNVHSIGMYTEEFDDDFDINLLRSEIVKLKEFVEELVKVSNVEVLGSEIETETVILNDIVLEAIKSNYAYAMEKDITIN